MFEIVVNSIRYKKFDTRIRNVDITLEKGQVDITLITKESCI